MFNAVLIQAFPGCKEYTENERFKQILFVTLSAKKAGFVLVILLQLLIA